VHACTSDSAHQLSHHTSFVLKNSENDYFEEEISDGKNFTAFVFINITLNISLKYKR